MKSYEEFSEIYDALIDDIDYNRWVNFIMDKLNDKSRNILEAACGTGNVTIKLAQNDYNITAFDLSQEMLVKAYLKLKKYNNVRLLNQNMINFQIDKKFDAVICCCDGVNYLKNEEEALNFFNLAYMHLKEDGILIFDISTFYKYIHILGNETFVYDNDNIFYVWENKIDKSKMKIDMEINFFNKIKNSSYERIIEIQSQKIYTVDKMKQLLNKANFNKIVVYDNYCEKPYNDVSERAVFCCQKSEYNTNN